MSRNYNFCGGWALIVKVREESYIGWGGMDEPKGDVLELYQIGDGADCPVCAVTYAGVEFCPHCGERIREDQA
jgi:DNA-directed RNA polymerase subunit RPC12/RpoP